MYCGAVEFVCSPAAVRHVPVLLEECLSFLSPYAGGSFADLTFGGRQEGFPSIESDNGPSPNEKWITDRFSDHRVRLGHC